MNRARVAYEIRAEQDTGGSELHVALFHSKWNHTTKLPPIGMKIEFGECAPGDPPPWVCLHREDVRNSSELSKNLSWADRVAGVLRHKAPLSYGGLFDELGIAGDGAQEKIVRQTLDRGHKTGRFARLPDGRWALALEREPNQTRTPLRVVEDVDGEEGSPRELPF
jgi:hypothetical protein